MECSSMVDASPSFNTYFSNKLADIADRVVQEFRTDIGDDIFDFADGNNRADTGEDENKMTNTPTEKVKENEEDAPNDDELEFEFEFPVVCRDSNLFPLSIDDVLSDSQISPSYPLFDRSLLLDVDPKSSHSVHNPGNSKPSPVARLSLRMLLSEEHSASSSSSEADDLEGVMPGTYCIWKPQTDSRGKHKKSNSISFDNASKRWKVRDLLKRSYSDDNYSTGKESSIVLFTPPIATKQKINGDKVKKAEKTTKVASAVDHGSGTYSKAESNIQVDKAKAGSNRLPPYLPYRPDQLALYANFTGSSRNLYRY